MFISDWGFWSLAALVSVFAGIIVWCFSDMYIRGIRDRKSKVTEEEKPVEPEIQGLLFPIGGDPQIDELKKLNEKEKTSND